MPKKVTINDLDMTAKRLSGNEKAKIGAFEKIAEDFGYSLKDHTPDDVFHNMGIDKTELIAELTETQKKCVAQEEECIRLRDTVDRWLENKTGGLKIYVVCYMIDGIFAGMTKFRTLAFAKRNAAQWISEADEGEEREAYADRV